MAFQVNFPASIVSGQRFYYLKNAAALLELALVQYTMAFCVSNGYTPISTPDIVRNHVLEGCGFQPRGEHTQIYSVGSSSQDLSLVGTAEIPLSGLLMNQVFPAEKLPIKMVGFGRAYRAEAGDSGGISWIGCRSRREK